jgi:hypothetical protein
LMSTETQPVVSVRVTARRMSERRMVAGLIMAIK